MKRLLSLILVLCLLVSVFTALPLTASAATEDLAAAGETSGGFDYEILDDGTASITGYSGGDSAVVIPSQIDGHTVTRIGAAFNYRSDLTSITIPDTVTEIANSAFYSCYSLKDITVPDTLTYVGAYAFENTAWYSAQPSDTLVYVGKVAYAYKYRSYNYSDFSITIKDGTTAISPRAFYGCYYLKSITIPEGVMSIGFSAFEYCSRLESITFPESIVSVGSYALDDTAWFNSQPDGVVYVGKVAYKLKGECPSSLSIKEGTVSLGGSFLPYDRSALKSVTLPDSLIDNPASLLENCAGLEKIVVGSGNKLYDSRSNCNAIIETATNTLVLGCKTTVIPDSVTAIGDEAFYGCSGLTSITLPKSVTAIGKSAFSGCSGLTSVTLPKSITSISDYLFYHCTGLTGIIIPNSVTSIGYQAFAGCTGLTSVTIPKGVTEIDVYAFSDCTGLTSVTLSEGLKVLQGFDGCTGLTSVTIPEGVTVVAGFGNCTGLTSITLPSSVTKIGGYSFSGCTRLTSINIPDGVTSIGEGAFSDCVWLTSIDLPDGLTEIGSYAFYRCSGLTSISIPAGVATIKQATFSKCTGLKSVTISNGVVEIGGLAFADCTALTNIMIPASVAAMGFYGGQDGYATLNPFAGCTGLTRIVVDSRNSVFDSRLNCNAIIETETGKLVSGCYTTAIPDGVTVIGQSAFDSLTEMDSVYIPESVVEFSYQAFNKCPIKYVYYGGSEDAWKRIRFNYNYDIQWADVVCDYNPNSFVTKIGNFTLSVKKNTTLRLGYAFDDPAKEIKDIKALIELNDFDLIDRGFTVYVNNEKTTDYTLAEGVITVPMQKILEGDITIIFNGQPTTKFGGTAKLTVESDKIRTYKIGSVEYNEFININVPASACNETVVVFGKTAPGAVVSLYLDYEKDYDDYDFFDDDYGYDNTPVPVAVVTANKAGTYVAEITLDPLVEGRVYKITAEYTDVYGVEHSATARVVYDPEALYITEFTMTYAGITYDLLQPGKRTITFVKGYPFEFRVRFNSKIDKKVYITSTRNDKTKYMLTEYDENEKYYIAKGFFLPEEYGYVPGVLKVVVCDEGVSYTRGEVLYDRDPFNWSIDPRGFVYAGLESCRVYDATVTAYYIPFDSETDDDSFWDAPDESRMVLWDASEYDQINPLSTTLEGDYAWDVPEGWWKVVVTKDGYEDASSEWLPVPPPQLEVNIGLTTTMAPAIESAEAVGRDIVLTFVHPLKPDSLKKVTLKDAEGNDVDFTLDCTVETAPNGDSLTRIVTLKPTKPKAGEYTITVTDAVNYAGVKGSVSAKVTADDVPLYILGDVDGDGEITIVDATSIQRFLAELPTPWAFIPEAADADGDNDITIVDATAIQRYLADLPTHPGIGEPI